MNVLRRAWLISLGIGCAALAAGCTTLAPKPNNLDSLEVSGRFVAKTATESSPGRFFLRKQAGQLLLELSTPFGQTMARFSQTATLSTAWVAQPSPRELQGESLEKLSEQLLGWPVPVSTLAQWLSDLQAKGKQIAALPLTDGRWTLSVQDWFQPESADRPRLMQLSNRASDTPPIELRLIVETWEALP